MIHVLCWNSHYFKYLISLFILLGFDLFMLNKYHFSFVYFNWFILFTYIVEIQHSGTGGWLPIKQF